MDATLESITGTVTHGEVEEFLRAAVSTFGSLWDVDQIVGEVVPMSRAHVEPADLVHVVVAVYPEHRLLVRLDDERHDATVQEWEYLPAAP